MFLLKRNRTDSAIGGYYKHSGSDSSRQMNVIIICKLQKPVTNVLVLAV